MRGPFSRDSPTLGCPRTLVIALSGPRSHQKTSQISAEASQLCVGAGGDRCGAVQEDGDTRSKHLELLFHHLHPADQPPLPDRGLAGRAPSAETSPNQPSACQSGAVNRSRTVVVATPLLDDTALRDAGRRDPFQERAALRAQLDTGQRPPACARRPPFLWSPGSPGCVAAVRWRGGPVWDVCEDPLRWQHISRGDCWMGTVGPTYCPASGGSEVATRTCAPLPTSPAISTLAHRPRATIGVARDFVRKCTDPGDD